MITRSIYEVIIVNHETGEIIGRETRVATSSEAAMSKIKMDEICKARGLTVDDVEYVVLQLGSLRPVQEVTSTKVSKF